MQPAWVRRAIEKALTSGIARVELVVNTGKSNKHDSALLFKLYERLDRKMFAADALELASIEEVLQGTAKGVGFEEIKAADLDVVINFAARELNAELSSAAKHGVWFYWFGNPAGFNEVMNNIPVTLSALRGLHADKEFVVYQSVSPTLSRFSIRLNTNTYWKAAAFLARGLRELHENQERDQRQKAETAATNAVAANTETVNAEVVNTAASAGATNAAAAGMFLKLSGRAAGRAVEKFSTFEQWLLAYRLGEGEFKYLIPPVDRFWADPFPLKADGKNYIFFEDYVNSTGRAHISVVEVDAQGIVSGPTEVLKLECHLSYPFVFEWRGDYYMIPETGDRNRVELYRATSFPYQWEPQQVLLEANCPLDSTVIEVDGTWWMFVNIQEEGVAVNWDELHLYYSDSLFGPWKPHARNPIVSDVHSARPAGRLFWSNDVLYRPGQDSSQRYGYATTISQVTKLDPQDYVETEVLKICPDWDKDIVGIHTVNLVDDIFVVDCLAKRRRRGHFHPRPPKGSLDLLASANMEPQSGASRVRLSRMQK